jgi:hypothetical protein
MLAVSKSTPSRSSMTRLRHTRRRAAGGFGRLLAAVALLLQIALPGFVAPTPLGFGSGAGDFSHALCLATHEGETEKPAKQAPDADHHEHSACCFWYGGTGLGLAPGATLEAMAFAQAAIVFMPLVQVFPRRPTGSAGARAPPVRA